MKKALWTIVCLLLLTVSCKKDSDEASYSFIDQPIKGQIEGVDWTCKSSVAKQTSYDGEGLSFDLYAKVKEDVCNAYSENEDFVLFSLPAKVGVYELGFGDDKHTATLYYNAATMNYICTKGAIEIISIDTISNIVKCRADIKSESNNYVNGNFEATYCKSNY
jgi:hypothetical protein